MFADELKEIVGVNGVQGPDTVAGLFSAEHGIGIDKRESLARYTSPEKLKIMKNIKRILDPKDIMNPGKVLASADKS